MKKILSLIAILLLLVGCSQKPIENREKLLSVYVNEKVYVIATTESTVGDALYKEGMIDGKQDGYITTVAGITCNWDEGTYWAFYINGEYAMTGAYDTQIDENTEYKFEVTKK